MFIPRPRWTKDKRKEVAILKDQFIGEIEAFESISKHKFEEGVPLVDVSLALRVLERRQKWRNYSLELSLAVCLTIILLIYTLYARFIPGRYFVWKTIYKDLVEKEFLVDTFAYDLNTPLNVNASLGFFPNGAPLNTLSNLNPDTLKQIPPVDNYFYQQCLNSTGNWCLNHSQKRTFKTLRSTSEFANWLTTILNSSTFFEKNRLTNSSSIIFLGSAQLRQLRSTVPGALVSAELQEEVSRLNCSGPILEACNLNNDTLCEALYHKTARQLNSFLDPRNNDILLGSDSPSLSRRLSFYYPSDGYAYIFPRCDSLKARTDLEILTKDCDWVSEAYSSSFFLSFTAFESMVKHTAKESSNE